MIFHCWEDGQRVRSRRTEREVGTTCMLEDQHEGPHSFIPDDEVGIRFADAAFDGSVGNEYQPERCDHPEGDGCEWCCATCNYDRHHCPGCGTVADHHNTSCPECVVAYGLDAG